MAGAPRTQASLDSSQCPAMSSLLPRTAPALLHFCDQTHTCSCFLDLLPLPSPLLLLKTPLQKVFCTLRSTDTPGRIPGEYQDKDTVSPKEASQWPISWFRSAGLGEENGEIRTTGCPWPDWILSFATTGLCQKPRLKGFRKKRWQISSPDTNSFLVARQTHFN